MVHLALLTHGLGIDVLGLLDGSSYQRWLDTNASPDLNSSPHKDFPNMKITRTAGFLAALALTGVVTGCGSGGGTSLGSITNDMTPELMTLNQRPADVQRHMAYTNNVNSRMFWEDLGRTWYTDHPSRLNPIEIVSVSGKPH